MESLLSFSTTLASLVFVHGVANTDIMIISFRVLVTESDSRHRQHSCLKFPAPAFSCDADERPAPQAAARPC